MITEQAKQRACDLANAADRLAHWKPSNFSDGTFIPGSMLALAQLCQDISDAVEGAHKRDLSGQPRVPIDLHKFILPKPAPDPLADALTKAGVGSGEIIEYVRAHLVTSGYSVQPIKGEG